MKKIMILLGAAVMAACVNAATVSWSITYAGQGTTWSSNGATVMAFNGADFADIVKLVTVDGSETLASDLSAKALTTSTFNNFRGNAQVAATATLDAPDSMFWMIFADGSTEAGKSVLWTAATDVTDNQYTPPASGATLAMNAASFANSGTIAQFSSGEGEGGGTGAIPEPTSGLLLVLGAAGLALRRRRA